MQTVTVAQPSPIRLALAGLLSLAVAMGFGRFAYTPILPAMVTGLHLSRAQAGGLASANFAGYLTGALVGALPLKGSPRVWMIGGLAASVASTLAMGLTDSLVVLTVLRFVGGLASAAVLVFASTLVLTALARHRRPGLAAVHFAGVGAGVAASGALVSALEAMGVGWAGLWLWVGGLGAAVAAVAVFLLPPSDLEVPSPAAVSGTSSARPAPGFIKLVGAYGLLGFGYVITATFLMVIVRASPQARAVEPIVWVVVGLAAMPSIWPWSRLGERIGLSRAYALACVVEAGGVAVSVLWPTVPGVLLAALALGGTYMAITALGLAMARALAPDRASRALAIVTAAFALGQIAGPLVAGAMAERTGSFTAPSLLAAAALVIAAVLAGLMPGRH